MEGWHSVMSSVTGASVEASDNVMKYGSSVTTLVPSRMRPSSSRFMSWHISDLPPPEAPSCMITVSLSYGVVTRTEEAWAVIQPSCSPMSSSTENTPFLADGPGYRLYANTSCRVSERSCTTTCLPSKCVCLKGGATYRMDRGVKAPSSSKV